MTVDHLAGVSPDSAVAGMHFGLLMLGVELALCALLVAVAIFWPALVAHSGAELPDLSDGENFDHR